jgi:hypothetical protein
MEHSQYYHFPRHAREGAEIVVLPAEGHDCIGCFADQVKVTHALVLDLDEAVKEVKLLGEHGEEATQKIMELEALCKKLREDKTQLEGMVESHDELIMEFDTTPTMRMLMMRMMTMEETPPHPILLCHLLLPLR